MECSKNFHDTILFTQKLLVILCDACCTYYKHDFHIYYYFSSHEMIYKNATDFNQLKVFGSLYYASSLSTNRKKIDQRTHKCIFIGLKRERK